MTKMALKLDVRDPRVLDRLVDGELTDEQERELLLQLERDPSGWRRCALAFLEARCWQREMGRLRQRVGADCLGARLERLDQASSHAKPRHGSHWGWSVWALTIAATFLMAFTVGRFLPHSWRDGPPPNMLAQPRPQDRSQETLVARPTLPSPEAASSEYLASYNEPIGNLTLVDDSGRQFEVPVYNWHQGTADQMMSRGGPLPPELVRGLKRHEVRQYQRDVPVKLGDGRQVVVPVQELDIVPLRSAAY